MIDTRSPDSFEWRFVLVALGILALGVISIYSVSPSTTPKGQTPLYAKQLTWILIGLVAFLAAVAIDYHKLARHAYILYGFTLVLLALVLVTGRVSRGAQRWFAVGPVVFQPSEVAKLVLVLVLSKYFADVQRFGWIQRVIVPGLITLPGLLLILKQPDLGTAMSFTFIFVTMVLVGGLHAKALGLLVLFVLFATLIFLASEIAWKAKDPLGLLLATGILSMVGFCLMVNVGMTMGIFPIVGIPLPLMSYGGTTTVTSMAALGLLLNVKRRRLTLFYLVTFQPLLRQTGLTECGG